MQYSIINFNEVKLHKDMRLDADHYHPWHLKNLGKIRTQSQPLSEFIIHITGGATPLGAVYPGEGTPFLRVQNIMPNYISASDIKYLSPSQNREILRSQLKKDDVLLTITGAYGKSAVVPDEFVGANINQHSVKMTVRNIAPYFLSTFLNCKYGYSQSTRHIVGITRPALDYSAIKSFLIPDLDKNFQKIIASSCCQAEKSREDSKQRYNEAQILLLSELGLADWQPKQQLTFVKNFSDTERAGRIDADYFQPKYDKIEKGIEDYSNGSIKIRDEFKQNKSTFEIDPEKLYHYVEIGSVNVSIGEVIPEKVLGKDLPANAKRVLKKGDIIVSKVRTYRGAITIVQEDGYVGSGAFCVLRENGQINKETLLACLRSKLFLTWSWKPNTGTSYPTLGDNDILDFPIPILPKEKQTEIQEKVLESFNLRKRAKDLLEHAKRAVEIAIEQDEQAAINWLESVSEVA